MGLKAGDVVVLKSGGQALTVAEISGEDVECVWIGEEGDLFREKLPAAVLEQVDLDQSDDEDEDEQDDEAEDDEAEDDEEDEHDVDAHKPAEVA